MLKGLAITPPVLGRISIGKVVEKNGKRLPETRQLLIEAVASVFRVNMSYERTGVS